MTMSDGISPSPRGEGGGAGSAPSKSSTGQSSTTMIIRQFEINIIGKLVIREIKRDCCKPEVV